MKIAIVEICGGADTSAQGEIILGLISAALKNQTKIVLSFAGVNTATSSFANTAFVPLLEEFDLNFIKRHLQVINSTRQINEMIKTRLERESRVLAA